MCDNRSPHAGRQGCRQGKQTGKKRLGFERLRTGLRTHSCHETVGPCAFLVLKDDVRIVVGDKVFESGVVSRDFPLLKAGRGNGVLADVRNVLLEDEWSQFARTAAPIAATAGTTGQDGLEKEEEDEDGGDERRPTRAVRHDGRARRAKFT